MRVAGVARGWARSPAITMDVDASGSNLSALHADGTAENFPAFQTSCMPTEDIDAPVTRRRRRRDHRVRRFPRSTVHQDRGGRTTPSTFRRSA
jgi:hypothetical protein